MGRTVVILEEFFALYDNCGNNPSLVLNDDGAGYSGALTATVVVRIFNYVGDVTDS
jgi:hypothetical protein